MNAAADDAPRGLEALLRTNGGIAPEFPLPRLDRALAVKLIRRMGALPPASTPWRGASASGMIGASRGQVLEPTTEPPGGCVWTS